jgi:hypothetical protein
VTSGGSGPIRVTAQGRVVGPAGGPGSARYPAGGDPAGGDPAGGEGFSSTRRTPVTGVDILLVAAAFGTALLRPRLPRNLALVDGLLLVINVVAARGLVKRNNLGGEMFRRLLPWIWLLLIASFLALYGVGVPLWAVDTLARIVLAPVTFCSVLVLMSGRPDTVDRTRKAMLAAGALAAVSILLAAQAGPDTRQAGDTFRNANYAAHFIVTSIILLLGAQRVRGWIRWALAILFLAALAKTGSFGGIIQLLAATSFLLWRVGHKNPPLVRAAIRVVTLVLLLFIAAWSYTTISSAKFDAGSGLSSSRLDKSEGTRLDLWKAGLAEFRHHPMGLGPGGYSARLSGAQGLKTEIHSDPLAFLVEQGVLGLIAVIGLVAVLWRASGPGGRARLLLVAFGVAAITRQTFTYRHVWLALAVTMATDLNARRLDAKAAARASPLPGSSLPGPHAGG